MRGRLVVGLEALVEGNGYCVKRGEVSALKWINAILLDFAWNGVTGMKSQMPLTVTPQ